MNSLPKTVTRQRRGCDFNPGPTVPKSSTLTTRLPLNFDKAANKYEFVDLSGVIFQNFSDGFMRKGPITKQ